MPPGKGIAGVLRCVKLTTPNEEFVDIFNTLGEVQKYIQDLVKKNGNYIVGQELVDSSEKKSLFSKKGQELVNQNGKLHIQICNINSIMSSQKQYVMRNNSKGGSF